MAKRPITEAKQADRDALLETNTWKKELQLAEKREKDWLKSADEIIKRYRGEEKKKNRFNVLWSNTEILRPAIFNTKPTPDVRRRFRDADPLGKSVSEVLERCLHVHVDGYDTECAAKNDVLDGLLAGRGISFMRYHPQINAVPIEREAKEEATEDKSQETVDESLEYEQAIREHIDYRDFRHGYGRVWDEVPWVAARHQMERGEAEKKFGKDQLSLIKFERPVVDDKEKPGEQANETKKVAEFWEIWDKQTHKVFFFAENAQALLYPLDNSSGAPPIDFPDFFPCPEPLRIIENTGSLLPIPHFHLYEEQANELDKLSARIDKIINQLKLRGVYDAKLSEMADLMTADDNEMTPVQNAQAWRDGGLDKAISWMPTEQAVAVLQALYDARERQKAIIDELTGISDIIRGVTDANETYGAQQLKSQYASVRLQRMQREVQRYERDMLRLAAVVVCKFSQPTIAQMTDLKFPTLQQKQQLQAQTAMAQQQGQQGPDPAVLQVPAWEEVLQLMQSPAMRQYRIDIETDSTIAATLQSDMAGLTEVLTGMSQVLTSMAPMVQSGALPIDAAKEIAMAVVRRARMGMAVEDAFEKMKPPQPPTPPPDHSIEVAQINAQKDEQIAAMKIQAEKENSLLEHQTIANTEAAKANVDAQRVELETTHKAQLDALTKEHEAALKQQEIESNERLEMLKQQHERAITDANNQTKVLIAQITAQHQAEMQAQKIEGDKQLAQMQGDSQEKQQDKQLKHEKSQVEAPTVAAYEQVESQMKPIIEEIKAHLSKPRRVTRDENGKIVGIQ